MYMALTDYPRTLRTIGPDSTGHIRPYLSDWTGMTFARSEFMVTWAMP